MFLSLQMKDFKWQMLKMNRDDKHSTCNKVGDILDQVY